MARCLEIDLVGEKAFSILGGIQDWDAVKDSAAMVERVDGLSGLRDWGSVYVVKPASGPERHYIVTKE
jgi:hypothetical protein